METVYKVVKVMPDGTYRSLYTPPPLGKEYRIGVEVVDEVCPMFSYWDLQRAKWLHSGLADSAILECEATCLRSFPVAVPDSTKSKHKIVVFWEEYHRQGFVTHRHDVYGILTPLTTRLCTHLTPIREVS